MAWQLEALAVLIEGLGSIPRSHMATHDPSITPVLGDLMPSSGLLWHQAHKWDTDTQADKTPIHLHIKQNKNRSIRI